MKREGEPAVGTGYTTVGVYDSAATAYAEKYESSGARVEDIDRGFALCESADKPFVFEIGPANGRDAEVILERARKYLGVDVSKAMIDLAKEKLTQADFRVGDAVSFPFPEQTDLIFAFASLLHLDKDAMKQVLKKMSLSLNKDGITYISLKRKDELLTHLKMTDLGNDTFIITLETLCSRLCLRVLRLRITTNNILELMIGLL